MPHTYRQFVSKQARKGVSSFSEISALWQEHKKTLPAKAQKRKYVRKKPLTPKCRDKTGKFTVNRP